MGAGPGASPRRRLHLFRRRDFLLLITAGTISSAGDWVLIVGLPFVVYRLTGSPAATAGIFVAGFVPPIVLSSVAGVFVDRWPRRRTMVIADLLLAGSLTPLLWVHSASQLLGLYGAVLLLSSIDPFFGPAEGALIPRIVPPEELVQANGVYGAARQVSRLVGAAAGGLVVGLLGIAGLAAVDGVSFLLSAVLLLGVTELGAVAAPRVVAAGVSAAARLRAVAEEWRVGFRLAWRIRDARVVVLLAMTLGLGEGVFTALSAPFLVGVLHASGPEYGVFFSAQAVGGIVGGFLVASRRAGPAPQTVLPWGLAAFALFDGVLFNYPLVWNGILLAFVLVGMVGVPAAFGNAAFTALQQTVVEDRFRGRFLGMVATTMGLTMVVGVIAAGLLAPVLGVVPLLELQVAGPALGALLALWAWRAAPGLSESGAVAEARS